MRKTILSIILTASIALFGSVVIVDTPAYAGPFDASKKEACEGANLGQGGSCDKQASEKKINDLIATIINILSVIVGMAAVIMIIINGLRFITSNGDSNSVASARNGIIYALVGLVFVAFAQLIVRFVINRL